MEYTIKLNSVEQARQELVDNMLHRMLGYLSAVKEAQKGCDHRILFSPRVVKDRKLICLSCAQCKEYDYEDLKEHQYTYLREDTVFYAKVSLIDSGELVEDKQEFEVHIDCDD